MAVIPKGICSKCSDIRPVVEVTSRNGLPVMLLCRGCVRHLGIKFEIYDSVDKGSDTDGDSGFGGREQNGGHLRGRALGASELVHFNEKVTG